MLGLFLVTGYAAIVEVVAPGDWCLAAFWGWLVVGVALVFGVGWLYPDAG